MANLPEVLSAMICIHYYSQLVVQIITYSVNLDSLGELKKATLELRVPLVGRQPWHKKCAEQLRL